MTLTPDEVNVVENEDMQARIEDAIEIAYRYGQTDGSHHKTWVIDQMVRILLGSEYAYEDWVREYEDGGEYEWNRGVAP